MQKTSRLSEFLGLLDGAQTLVELGQHTLAVIAHWQLTGVASGIVAGSKPATAERFHFAHWSPGFLQRDLAKGLQAEDPQ